MRVAALLHNWPDQVDTFQESCFGKFQKYQLANRCRLAGKGSYNESVTVKFSPDVLGMGVVRLRALLASQLVEKRLSIRELWYSEPFKEVNVIVTQHSFSLKKSNVAIWTHQLPVCVI